MGLTIVNFGCGAGGLASSDYINMDGSPLALLARLPLPATFFRGKVHFVGQLRASRVQYATDRSLRLSPSSLDGFFTSHTLEHLNRPQCIARLRRIQGFLKPSGRLRVLLPYLRRLATDYLSGGSADTFLFEIRLTVLRKWWIGGHTGHRWMYDEQSFKQLLVS